MGGNLGACHTFVGVPGAAGVHALGSRSEVAGEAARGLAGPLHRAALRLNSMTDPRFLRISEKEGGRAESRTIRSHLPLRLPFPRLAAGETTTFEPA